ncbi:hypothetical protein PTKU46_77950 [Paraburkholderia terrae]|uniref:hypothetical protein n=1 Tax=Paraburkholderia terrae TaxID=311230 RepID=UPI0030E0FF60
MDDREAAVAVHTRLREERASIIAMGRFYLSLLDKGLWPSQRAIAADLGISLPQISRMVATVRLPEAVLSLFDNRPVSFREVETLRMLAQQLGEEELTRRARSLTHGASLEDIFSFLTTGKPKARRGVRLSLVHGQRYLRLDVPNFEQVAPRIVQLEQILNALLATGDSRHWLGALTGKPSA